MTPSIRLPRVLLTNDDGIEAQGLAVLAEVASTIADEVWVVAPERDCSGSSVSFTCTRPLRVRPCGERRWTVSGTPADCVALALSHFMIDAKPSLVLSGINPNANIGDEVNLSGTVGAAMVGMMLGSPSIAISLQSASRRTARWDTARAVLPKVLQQLLAQGWRKETFLSINIPDKKAEEIHGLSWARQSQKNISGFRAEKRTSPRQEDYFWLSLERQTPANSIPNSEHAILRRDEVAVTALSPDRSVDIRKPSVSFNPPAEE